MTDTTAALNAAVEAMHTGDNMYDVTIVCTTDDHQAAYWWIARCRYLLTPPRKQVRTFHGMGYLEDWAVLVPVTA
jgi:hypothetical protein